MGIGTTRTEESIERGVGGGVTITIVVSFSGSVLVLFDTPPQGKSSHLSLEEDESLESDSSDQLGAHPTMDQISGCFNPSKDFV